MKKCKRSRYHTCGECFTFTFKCSVHGCHRCYNDKVTKFRVAKLNFQIGDSHLCCQDVSSEHGVGCTRHREHGGEHGNFWRNPPVRWKKEKRVYASA